jgi:FeS assembly SUF system protein
MAIFNKKKSVDTEKLKTDVIEALRGIYDPEIPVNIYDLGLIYNVEAFKDGNVIITMTLTTPHCPVAESMPKDVKEMAESTGGAKSALVNLVWEPPWTQDMMTEAARLELGLF